MTTSQSSPPPSSPSILILTAAFGEGHNAAARNLKAALLECSPGCPVEIHDIFRDTYGWRHEIMRKGYCALINYFPAVWSQMFEIMDKTSVVSSHVALFSAAATKLRNLLVQKSPQIVITVFPGYGILLDFLHTKGLKRSYQMITLLTDSLSINSIWYKSYSDVFIAPNPQTSTVLQKAGIASHIIHPLGFPVPLAFAKIPSQKHVPRKGEKWRVLYMVNAQPRQAPAILKHLLNLENTEITVTVGKNEALAAQLKQLAASHQRPLEVYGWTPRMPELIARSHVLIGKAGGATVQEALAGRTPLLITQIVPGQEEGNGRLILENGAGAFASKPSEIFSKLSEAFAEEGARWEKWFYAANALSQPEAALNIARFLLSQGY